MGHIVEREWTTAAGLPAVCVIVTERDGRRMHRCGYVGVHPDHPLHGVEYDQKCPALAGAMATVMEGTVGKRNPITVMGMALSENRDDPTPEQVFNVHGSLTYARAGNEPPLNAPLWWFGFDCAHCDDGWIDSFGDLSPRGVVRSLEYVEAECESLAQQISEAVSRSADGPCEVMSKTALATHARRPFVAKGSSVIDAEGKIVGQTVMNRHGPISDEDELACLFAAAPDLLEACKDFAHGRKESRECEGIMLAAIAKAEGRQP